MRRTRVQLADLEFHEQIMLRNEARREVENFIANVCGFLALAIGMFFALVVVGVV